MCIYSLNYLVISISARQTRCPYISRYPYFTSQNNYVSAIAEKSIIEIKISKYLIRVCQASPGQSDINHRRLRYLKFLSVGGISHRVIRASLNFVRVGEHERLACNSSDDLAPSINKHKCALEDLYAYSDDA